MQRYVESNVSSIPNLAVISFSFTGISLSRVLIDLGFSETISQAYLGAATTYTLFLTFLELRKFSSSINASLIRLAPPFFVVWSWNSSLPEYSLTLTMRLAYSASFWAIELSIPKLSKALDPSEAALSNTPRGSGLDIRMLRILFLSSLCSLSSLENSSIILENLRFLFHAFSIVFLSEGVTLFSDRSICPFCGLTRIALNTTLCPGFMNLLISVTHPWLISDMGR